LVTDEQTDGQTNGREHNAFAYESGGIKLSETCYIIYLFVTSYIEMSARFDDE